MFLANDQNVSPRVNAIKEIKSLKKSKFVFLSTLNVNYINLSKKYRNVIV
jgi:hypothetical protein